MTARVLHWLIAALVHGMIPVGIIIANEWGGAWQERLYNLHKSVGRRAHSRSSLCAADLPRDSSAGAAARGHSGAAAFRRACQSLGLYILLLVQPLLGWIATSAYPAPVSVFGLFNLPQIWPANRALSDQLFAWHRAIGITLGVLVAMHVAGALYHHFVRRDRVLMRMITGG